MKHRKRKVAYALRGLSPKKETIEETEKWIACTKRQSHRKKKHLSIERKRERRRERERTREIKSEKKRIGRTDKEGE